MKSSCFQFETNVVWTRGPCKLQNTCALDFKTVRFLSTFLVVASEALYDRTVLKTRENKKYTLGYFLEEGLC